MYFLFFSTEVYFKSHLVDLVDCGIKTAHSQRDTNHSRLRSSWSTTRVQNDCLYPNVRDSHISGRLATMKRCQSSCMTFITWQDKICHVCWLPLRLSVYLSVCLCIIKIVVSTLASRVLEISQ